MVETALEKLEMWNLVINHGDFRRSISFNRGSIYFYTLN